MASVRCAPYSEMPKTIAPTPGESSASPRQSSAGCSLAVRRGAAGSAAGGQQAARQQQPDDPDRQVHEEDPAPDRFSTIAPPITGPKTGASSIGTPTMLITRPMRLGPGRLGQGDHPDRHDHAAGEALKHAEADQRLGAPGQAAQGARHDEARDGGHPHALGPEALGGPAGQRDRGREREQVARC